MQQARNVTLDLLKPSPAQLERGLRLHAESFVFDSYGFSPRAAIDGTTPGAVIEAGASQQEVEDLQEDMTMTHYVTDAVEQREYLDAWRVSGVTCGFQNAGQECQDPLRLLKRLARFTWVTDMLRSDVIRAIADTGGYIRICCISSFLRGTGDIRAFPDHLEYAVRTFGAEHIAKGTYDDTGRKSDAICPRDAGGMTHVSFRYRPLITCPDSQTNTTPICRDIRGQGRRRRRYQRRTSAVRFPRILWGSL